MEKCQSNGQTWIYRRTHASAHARTHARTHADLISFYFFAPCNGPCAPMEKWHRKEHIVIIYRYQMTPWFIIISHWESQFCEWRLVGLWTSLSRRVTLTSSSPVGWCCSIFGACPREVWRTTRSHVAGQVVGCTDETSRLFIFDIRPTVHFTAKFLFWSIVF